MKRIAKTKIILRNSGRSCTVLSPSLKVPVIAFAYLGILFEWLMRSPNENLQILICQHDGVPPQIHNETSSYLK